MLIERVLMTKELVELQNEFNELADNYFPSPEAKQTWFERKHYMVFGDCTPSELYFTEQGLITLIEELHKLRSDNLA